MIQIIKKPLMYVLENALLAYCLRKASHIYVAIHYLKDTARDVFVFWVERHSS
jgi:hypothetical protein